MTVMIDWSAGIPLYQTADTQTNIDLLLSWVRASPRGSRVHVVLRRALNDLGARRIQNTLQAMGCIVTAKGILC